jgi:hypothetical protein
MLRRMAAGRERRGSRGIVGIDFDRGGTAADAAGGASCGVEDAVAAENPKVRGGGRYRELLWVPRPTRVPRLHPHQRRKTRLRPLGTPTSSVT